jgi:hypothetical protein
MIATSPFEFNLVTTGPNDFVTEAPHDVASAVRLCMGHIGGPFKDDLVRELASTPNAYKLVRVGPTSHHDNAWMNKLIDGYWIYYSGLHGLYDSSAFRRVEGGYEIVPIPMNLR